MSLLLDNNIFARLLQVNVITGLVLLIIGILFASLAGVITKSFRKTDKVASDDKIYLSIKAFALIVVVVSLILMIIQ